MQEKRYDIGGVIYLQRALVLGQIRQLIAVIEGTVIHPDAGPAGIIRALGEDKLPQALAIVLTPENVELRNKNLAELAGQIEFAITPERIFEVIEDFFDCNPTVSILEKLRGVMVKMRQALPTSSEVTGSTISPVSSPTEISPAETPLSGDSPQPSVAPTSVTATES